ncbi:ROK family protein [Streptomyces violaceoruber]
METPGSQSSLHRANLERVVRAVRLAGSLTQAEIARTTGLSAATVSNIVREWRDGGTVEVTPTSAGGRRARSVSLSGDAGIVIGVDFGHTHLRVAVGNLAHQVLAEESEPLDVDASSDQGFDRAEQLVSRLIEATGVDRAKIAGVGLGVPGPIDVESGTLGSTAILPGWGGIRPAEELRGRLGVPVHVDNDANLMALAEHQANHRDCASFVLLKVSTGIGAGVVIGDRLYRGIDGGAGDIGHIRLHDRSDALCMCGSHGCLAAVASGRAIAGELAALGHDTASGRDVRRLLNEGHPDAVRLAREAGRRVGEVLVTVVTLLNPGVLMIAGELAGVPFLTGVRELVYQRAMPRATANLQVVTSRLGDHAGLVGAAAMVVEHLYSPAGADARLERLAS